MLKIVMEYLKNSILLGVAALVLFSGATPAFATVRIKEIAQFEGARENQLMGYGIVVGLNGTGDKGKSVFTVKAIANLLTRLGVKVSSQDISVKNAAAVMVTATLPPFVKGGTKLDVTLSSLGDAKTLAGGILLQTPLQGPDGTVYAVAQGAVSIGGLSGGKAEGGGTVARIPDGALVEKEVPVTMLRDGNLTLLLLKNDFTTCSRIAEAINLEFGQTIAYPLDGGTVVIHVPELFRQDIVKLIAKVEVVEVIPDYKARIVINEKTGTIVGGRDARISRASLSHGNIHIEIMPAKDTEKDQEQQVSPQSLVHSINRYSEALFEENADKKEAIITDEISVGELASYLSSLGVAPKDLVTILQSIKAANAIQAEIVVI